MTKVGVLWLYVTRDLTPWKERISGETIARLVLASPPGYESTICHYLPVHSELGPLVARYPLVFNLCFGFADRTQASIASWLDTLGVALTSPSGEAQARAADKANLPDLCNRLGIATPPLLDRRALQDFRGLVITKPRIGACHRDLLIVDTREVGAERLEAPDRLVQPYLVGREFTVAVVPTADAERVMALPPAEIVPTPPRVVYAAGRSYGTTRFETRPELPEQLAAEMARASLALHEELGLHAFSRMDFRVVDGRPYVLDVNSMPNLDPTSSYLPEMAVAHGIGLESLLDRILRFSLAAGPRRVIRDRE